MELMVNPLLLMVTLIVFMMTPTSHSTCVARQHNSTTSSSHPPSPPPPTTPSPALRPPQKKTTTHSQTATSFKPTPGSTPQDDLSGSIFSRSTHAVDPRLKRICADTDYPSLCLASLSPALANSGKSVITFNTALGVAIKATTQQARLGVAAAARLAKAPGAVEDAGDGLGVCQDSYTDALDNLRAAAEAMATKDLGTANSMLSAVVTNSENCGDALDGTEAGETMTKYNDKLRMLASNCLAIASFIN